MPALLPLFVRLNGEVRGPFTPEQLGQLAEVGAITPETEASTIAGGPSVRLKEFPACAALFPGRECLGSKAEAKAFETVNGPGGPTEQQSTDSTHPSGRPNGEVNDPLSGSLPLTAPLSDPPR